MIKFRIAPLALLSLLMAPNVWAQSAYVMTEADYNVLHAGKALTHVWRDKSRKDKALDVFGAIDVMAKPETIWALMTDCSRGMEIVKGMESCKVLETSEDGSDIRQQIFDMGPFLPNAKTEFRSEYELNRRIKIRRTGGDLKIQDALWEITPLTKYITRVSYRGTIKLKFPVPPGLIKNATRKDTPQIMRNLRRVAENDENSVL